MQAYTAVTLVCPDPGPEQSCEQESGLLCGRQADGRRERERDSLSSTVVSQTSQISRRAGGGLATTMNILVVVFSIPSGL